MNKRSDYRFGCIFTAIVVAIAAVVIFFSERASQIEQADKARDYQIGSP